MMNRFLNLILLIFILSNYSVFAQTTSERPRLVVAIMVDGMQHQHLQQLWTRFNGDGFKRLTSDGASFQRLTSMTTSYGNASDIATLYTGTVPYYHGITGDRVLNPTNSELQSVFFDKNQSGIQSHLQLSGKAMEASTWVDELMMEGRTRSKSFVIAIQPEDAIAMGGHSVNGAVWLDDVMFRWGSTDYYPGGMPWQAAQQNTAEVVKKAADNRWTSLFAPRTYLEALTNPSLKDFSFTPSDKQTGSGSVSLLRTTPAANSLVMDLAKACIKEQELGKDLHPDALLLQFTVRTPGEQSFSELSMAKEDMYLRLDNNLQDLITTTNAAVGEGKVLYVLYGSQSDTRSPAELQKFNFHAGYYNSYRSMALLNSYLMALYGQEKWVRAYYGRHIYLNRKLIEEKGHNFAAFQQVVADFVSEFEGVQSAWPLQQLLMLPINPDTDIARLRNSVHRKSAGDVVILLKPGWLETDERNRPVGESGSLNTHFPVYLSGWKIAPQLVREPHTLNDIAPTLTSILRIPRPNASIGKEVQLLLNN